jgi:hypothetical protein
VEPGVQVNRVPLGHVQVQEVQAAPEVPAKAADKAKTALSEIMERQALYQVPRLLLQLVRFNNHIVYYSTAPLYGSKMGLLFARYYQRTKVFYPLF